MKINREKLLEALGVSGSVAGKRTTLPILNCVRLGSRVGRLQIRGTDLDRDIIAEVDCDGDLPQVCLPVRLIASFSQHSNAETIDIKQISDGWIRCDGGSTSAEIPYMPLKDFPADLTDKETAVGVNTKDIADGIEAVSWAAIAEHGDFIVSCVRIRAKEGRVICEACDRRTLAYFSRGSIAADFDFLLPFQSAMAAVDFLRRDGAVLSVGEKSMSVKYEGAIFTAKLANANPLASHLLLGVERQPLGKIKRSELLSALVVCMVPNSDKFFQIEFQFSSSGLRLECEESGFKLSKAVSGQFAPYIGRLGIDRAYAALKAIKEENLSVFSAQNCIGFQFSDQVVLIARVHKAPPTNTMR